MTKQRKYSEKMRKEENMENGIGNKEREKKE